MKRFLLSILTMLSLTAHAGFETGTANQVLRVPAAGGRPKFGQIDLSQLAAIKNQLPIANGGTNLASVGTDGQALMSNGTAMAFQTFQNPSDIINIGLSTSVATNAMTITLTTGAGAAPSSTDPARIMFRNSTAATGSFVARAITGTVALTIPASATLGCASAVLCEIYVYALDNAGVVELAVASSYWTEDLQSTTAITSGSTAANILYSNSARTSKAVRLLGLMQVTETTAGTWASNVTAIKLAPYLKIDIGSQLYAGMYTSGGTDVSTQSASVIDLSTTTGTSIQTVGLATAVTNDFRLRVSYFKPGRYFLTSSFTAEGLSNVATGCEFYSLGIMSASYSQVSQSNSTNDGPFFGITLTGWAAYNSWSGQTDQYIRWRRTGGTGFCRVGFGSAGGPFYHTLMFWPMVNGI